MSGFLTSFGRSGRGAPAAGKHQAQSSHPRGGSQPTSLVAVIHQNGVSAVTARWTVPLDPEQTAFTEEVTLYNMLGSILPSTLDVRVSEARSMTYLKHIDPTVNGSDGFLAFLVGKTVSLTTTMNTYIRKTTAVVHSFDSQHVWLRKEAEEVLPMTLSESMIVDTERNTMPEFQAAQVRWNAWSGVNEKNGLIPYPRAHFEGRASVGTELQVYDPVVEPLLRVGLRAFQEIKGERESAKVVQGSPESSASVTATYLTTDLSYEVNHFMKVTQRADRDTMSWYTTAKIHSATRHPLRNIRLFIKDDSIKLSGDTDAYMRSQVMMTQTSKPYYGNYAERATQAYESMAPSTLAAPSMMRSPTSSAPRAPGRGGAGAGGSGTGGEAVPADADEPPKPADVESATPTGGRKTVTVRRKEAAGRMSAEEVAISDKPWDTLQRTEPITVAIDTIDEWPVKYGLYWEATEQHSFPKKDLRFDVDRADKSKSVATSLIRGDVSVRLVTRSPSGSGESSSVFVGQARIHKTMKTHNIIRFDLGDEELVTCKRTVVYMPDNQAAKQRDSYTLYLTNLSPSQTFSLRVRERFQSPNPLVVTSETDDEIVRSGVVEGTIFHANTPVENAVREFVVSVPPGSKTLKYAVEYYTR